MTGNRTEPDNVPAPATPERQTKYGSAREKKIERELRYEAQLIAEREGVSLEQAMEIAKHQAREIEKGRREHQAREAKERELKRERRHDRSKRDRTPVVKTRGPPMRGGAPGLGKR